MQRISLLLLSFMLSGSALLAQSFTGFINRLPELPVAKEKNLKEDLSFLQQTISTQDAANFLKENADLHSMIGKYTLSKCVVLVYYSKPAAGMPLGKISAATFTTAGKLISREAIGVYADFTGMHFNMSFIASAQSKGSLSLSSNVQAFKDNGDPNESMSKITIYIIAAKGKITKMY